MEKSNEKRVLRVELNDDVKKVSITGLGSDEKVVMRQDINEEELNKVTGGGGFCDSYRLPPVYDEYWAGIAVCQRNK